MNLGPSGEQLFQKGLLLPVKRRYPVRQEFTDSPKVIGDTCRYRRGHGTPAPRGTGAERGFRSRQGGPQTGMGQDQMVVSQGQPQLFFKPGDVFGKSVGTPGEAAILLPLGQVVPFDETGVDRLTNGGLSQSGGHDGGIAEHDAGPHRDNPPPTAVLDHLGIQEISARVQAGFGMGASRPASGWTVPFAIRRQQGVGVGRPLIAGKKREDRRVGHVGDLPEQAVSARLIAFAHHKPQHQTPDGGKGQPHPGIPMAIQIVLRSRQIFLLGMDKTPQFIQLALGHREIPPQVQHHRAALACRSIQPATDQIAIDLDDSGGRAQRIPFRQCPQGRLECHRVRPQAIVSRTVAQGHAASTRLTAGLRFAPATAIANQPPDFEGFSMMLTAAVWTIQSLPVQANLLDKDMISIEDANFSSTRGKFITEVKGHYLKNKEPPKTRMPPSSVFAKRNTSKSTDKGGQVPGHGDGLHLYPYSIMFI